MGRGIEKAILITLVEKAIQTILNLLKQNLSILVE